MYLANAIRKQAGLSEWWEAFNTPGKFVDERQGPLIPGFVDLKIRDIATGPSARDLLTPGREAVIKQTQDIEAIPRLGAYGVAAGAGGIAGSGLGAIVAPSGYRTLGAATGGITGAIAAPLLLAMAKRKGMLKLTGISRSVGAGTE